MRGHANYIVLALGRLRGRIVHVRQIGLGLKVIRENKWVTKASAVSTT
jgi:hypothetical protein